MVVETVTDRERTSQAVLETLRQRGNEASYAVDLVEVLEPRGIDAMHVISTVWRLIDENRLFLDDKGALLLEATDRD